MWPGSGFPLPTELVETRDWVFEVFKEAGRGLPWPQQLGLLLIAQAIVAGMFASLLAPSWLLKEPGVETLLDPLVAALPPGLRQLAPDHLDALTRALSAMFAGER